MSEATEHDPADESARGARRWLPFLLIFALALTVRLVHLSQLQASPLIEHPVMDAAVHHEWAQSFAAGEEWVVDRRSGEPLPYFRAPFYIWFLGTVYKLFGVDASFAPRLLQSILGSISCGLIYLIAARLFGRATGIVAGLAAALFWTMVYFDNELLLVPWIVFFNLLLLWFLIVAHDRGNWYWWSAAGLALGMEAITRPNILLFAPAVCLWILVLRLRERRFALGIGHCFAFGLALLTPILPLTIRNVAKADDFVLIASQGGVNFFIGNNAQSDGVTAVVPGTPPDWWGGYYATQGMAAQELGRTPKASEVSQFFFAKAGEWWSEDRAAAIAHTLYKARLFLYRQEYANNKCIYTFSEEFTPLSAWLPVGLWIVMPLGLLGAALSLRRPGRHFPLWGFALIYTASVVMFFVNARFRMPVATVLVIFASHAVFWLLEQLRERAWLKLVPALVGLALFSHLSHWFPGFSDGQGGRIGAGYGEITRNTEEAYWTLGMQLAKRGENEPALLYLEKMEIVTRDALKNPPSDGRAQMMQRILSSGLAVKGDVLEKLGRDGQALRAFRESLKILPRTPERAIILKRAALLYEKQGRASEALPFRQEAQAIKRDFRLQGPIPTDLTPLMGA